MARQRKSHRTRETLRQRLERKESRIEELGRIQHHVGRRIEDLRREVERLRERIESGDGDGDGGHGR